MLKFSNLFIVILLTFASFQFMNAQNVGINSTGAAPAASAMLDVSSTTSGMLVPRMTVTERNNIASPATGLLIYQTNSTPGFYYYDGSAWTAVSGGSSSSGLSAYGYGYELATIADATVVGGADVPFSNNGPQSGVLHTAGTTTFTVISTGTYEISYHISITAGVGSAIALAVNGSVDASTPIPALVATGNISGTAILTLVVGDVVTLRNNSATPLVMTFAPAAAGAQITFKKLD